jgi:hypothetical protein
MLTSAARLHCGKKVRTIIVIATSTTWVLFLHGLLLQRIMLLQHYSTSTAGVYLTAMSDVGEKEEEAAVHKKGKEHLKGGG